MLTMREQAEKDRIKQFLLDVADLFDGDPADELDASEFKDNAGKIIELRTRARNILGMPCNNAVCPEEEEYA